MQVDLDVTGVPEVAERGGVATSSVPRVLSGHPDVSPKMRGASTAAARTLLMQGALLALPRA